jgi:hypothetical protein
MRTYISQHVVQARGLLALPACVIGAGVLCLFYLKVQEDFMVGEKGCLGVFDLGGLVGRYCRSWCVFEEDVDGRACDGKRKWGERIGDNN